MTSRKPNPAGDDHYRKLDPKKGKPIRGLQHQVDCAIYKADIEKVLKSTQAAMGYCTCDTFDPLTVAAPEDHCLIWSNEHSQWWKPGGAGYTQNVHAAGHFERRRALRICAEANVMLDRHEVPNEIPVRVVDFPAYAKEQAG